MSRIRKTIRSPRRVAFLVWCCLLAPAIASANAGYTVSSYVGIEWQLDRVRNEIYQYYHLERNGSYGLDATIDAENNIYVLSQSSEDGKISLLKIDKEENKVWDKKISRTTPSRMENASLTMSSSQDSFLAVFQPAGFHFDKYGTDGALLWDGEVSRDGGSFQTLDEILADRRDNFILFGDWETNGVIRKALLKLNGNGAIVWLAFVEQSIAKSSIALDPENDIYLAGIKGESAEDPGEIVLLKYNAQGEILWSAFHTDDEPALSYSRPALAVDEQSNVTVLTAAESGGGDNLLESHRLLAFSYSPAGAGRWTFTETLYGYAVAGEVLINSQNGPILSAVHIDSEAHVHLFELNADGSPARESTYPFNHREDYKSEIEPGEIDLDSLQMATTINRDDQVYFIIGYLYDDGGGESRILLFGSSADDYSAETYPINDCYDQDKEVYFHRTEPLYFKFLGKDIVYRFIEDNDIESHSYGPDDDDHDDGCGCENGSDANGGGLPLSALMFLAAVVAFILAKSRKED